MLSATVMPDTQSKAEPELDGALALLLKAASDPETFNKRLKELQEKTKAVQAAVKQSRTEARKAEVARQAAEDVYKKTEALKGDLSKREVALNNLEHSLNDRTVQVTDRETALAGDKDRVAQELASLSARKQNMTRAEKASASKIANDQAVFDKQIADKEGALDAAHKARMDSLAKQSIDLLAANKAATDEKAAAEAVKADYQSKVAKLKSFIE